MKITALTAMLLVSGPAVADPPAEMFSGVPNVGRVWITVCAAGQHGCYKVEPKAWGQLCDPGGASFAAESWVEQNPVTAKVFHPVRWECQDQMNLKTAPWPMSGPLTSK